MAEGQSPETSAEWEAAYHRVLRLLRTAEAEIKRIRARAGISEFHAYPSPQARRDVEWLLGEVDRQRRVCDLAAELCNSIDSWAEDIGGYRRPDEILKDLGPAVSELEKANG